MKKCPICGCENNVEIITQEIVSNDKSLNAYICHNCKKPFITAEKAISCYDVEKLKKGKEENFNAFLSHLQKLYLG